MNYYEWPGPPLVVDLDLLIHKFLHLEENLNRQVWEREEVLQLSDSKDIDLAWITYLFK